jgi:cytochrome bd-type quinol oxidase subunit 2
VENYIVRVVTKERAFPFRAWLAASIGIPIGAILILAFIIRGYMTIFDNNRRNEHPSFNDQTIFKTSKLSFIGWIQSLSLFHLGVVVLVLLIALWIIPNAVSEIAAKIVSFMERHPVICAGFLLFAAVIVVWVIYLRYKLSREVIRYQFELAKMRLERKALPEYQELDQKLLGNPSSIEPKEISDERRDHHGMV